MCPTEYPRVKDGNWFVTLTVASTTDPAATSPKEISMSCAMFVGRASRRNCRSGADPRLCGAEAVSEQEIMNKLATTASAEDVVCRSRVVIPNIQLPPWTVRRATRHVIDGVGLIGLTRGTDGFADLAAAFAAPVSAQPR